MCGLPFGRAPYLPAMVLVAISSSILQCHDRFAIGAAMPVIFNLCLVIALIAAALDWLAIPTKTMAIAVLVAGILQALVMIIAVFRAKIAFSWFCFTPSREMNDVFRRAFPGIVGAGVTQINLVIGDILASFLMAGAISWLYFADRLVQLPLALIGIALSLSLLPILSKAIAAGALTSAHTTMNEVLRVASLLAFGAAVGLFTLSEPLITVLFGRGTFDAQDIAETAYTLQAFTIGLPALIATKCLVQGFFARLDTKTPIIIAMICIFINLTSALVLSQYFAHIGIALGASIAGWMNCLLIAWIAHKRNYLQLTHQTYACFLKLPWALGAMIIIIFFMKKVFFYI
ncbi:MAG: lipid II flippase MurJ, partial [Pseudomonadota bacterium]